MVYTLICYFILFIIAIPIYLLERLYTRIKRNKKVRMVDESLDLLRRYDQKWDKGSIIEFVTENYKEIQRAWTHHDRKRLRELLMQDLYIEWNAMLNAMDLHQQRNIVKNVFVHSVKIIDIRDSKFDRDDHFTVRILSSARRYTVTRDGRVVPPAWKEDRDYSWSEPLLVDR